MKEFKIKKYVYIIIEKNIKTTNFKTYNYKT